MFKKHFLVIGLVLLCFVLFPANKVEACDTVWQGIGFPVPTPPTTFSIGEKFYNFTTGQYYQLPGCFLNTPYFWRTKCGSGCGESFGTWPAGYISPNGYSSWPIPNQYAYPPAPNLPPGWIGVESSQYNFGSYSWGNYSVFQPAAQNVYNFWSGDLCGTTSGGNNPANIQSWNYGDPNCFRSAPP